MFSLFHWFRVLHHNPFPFISHSPKKDESLKEIWGNLKNIFFLFQDICTLKWRLVPLVSWQKLEEGKTAGWVSLESSEEHSLAGFLYRPVRMKRLVSPDPACCQPFSRHVCLLASHWCYEPRVTEKNAIIYTYFILGVGCPKSLTWEIPIGAIFHSFLIHFSNHLRKMKASRTSGEILKIYFSSQRNFYP